MNDPTDLERLLAIMAKLRSPQGCPWDREQTHQSIKPQLVEECYELVEAIDATDDAHLKEELGDVLLHLIFHARMAEERQAFNFQDVIQALTEKIIRRHPHVFTSESLPDAGAVLARWQELKAREKPERTSALDGVPVHLPALMKCQELQKKAARVGFDWPEAAGVWEKVAEELAELRRATSPEKQAEEFGDLLFSLVNLARHLGLDAEETCRQAAQKFERRFRAVENDLQRHGRSMKNCSLEELDAAWNRVKTCE